MIEPRPRGIQDWRAAEQNAAEWMRYWGYLDARITGGSADRGLDVRSSGALAQVKMQGNAVGRPAIQNLVGARGLQHDKTLLFFANAGYAATAVEEANRIGVALFTYNVATGHMIPENATARRLLAGVETARVRRQPVEGSPYSGPAVIARPAPKVGKAKPKAHGPRGIGWPLLWAVLLTLSTIGNATEPSEDAPVASVVTAGVTGVLAVWAWWVVVSRRMKRREARDRSKQSAREFNLQPRPVARQEASPRPFPPPAVEKPALAREAAGQADSGRSDNVVSGREAMEAGGTYISPADVDWFDYQATEDELASAFVQVWLALGDLDTDPEIETPDSDHFRFTMAARPGYLGLKSIVADMEVRQQTGRDVVRLRWSTHSAGTPSDAERVATDAHEAAARANRIISDAVGEPIAQGPEL